VRTRRGAGLPSRTFEFEGLQLALHGGAGRFEQRALDRDRVHALWHHRERPQQRAVLLRGEARLGGEREVPVAHQRRGEARLGPPPSHVASNSSAGTSASPRPGPRQPTKQSRAGRSTVSFARCAARGAGAAAADGALPFGSCSNAVRMLASALSGSNAPVTVITAPAHA
jgi:hypothetical protein